MPTKKIEKIRLPVRDDLSNVDQLIIKELVSDVPLIQMVTEHIVKSGGKRLRPLLTILSARASGYAKGDEHLELAAIIEFVHTATLLHDDVVDESSMRRGKQTANDIWGNQASVLVGDFLYSRAFQILTRRSNTPIMQILANTTNALAEGEVLQLMNRNDPDITEQAYLDVITRKTAKLFESAAEIGAILGDPTLTKAAATYGLNLGLAFQIVDDVLDYTSDKDALGKNVGDDLAEGKATLPLLYTLHNTTTEVAQQITKSIKDGGLDHINEILKAMHACKAIEYCHQRAEDFINTAKDALQNFPTSQYCDALFELADFALSRQY